MAVLILALVGGLVGAALLSEFGGFVFGLVVGAVAGWVVDLAGRVRALERQFDARKATEARVASAKRPPERDREPVPAPAAPPREAEAEVPMQPLPPRPSALPPRASAVPAAATATAPSATRKLEPSPFDAALSKA